MKNNKQDQGQDKESLQGYHQISKYYSKNGNILTVVNSIHILIMTKQNIFLHAFKNLPETQFQSDLSVYMFNFLMAKVNFLSIILLKKPMKKTKNLFLQKFEDESSNSYQFHEILGITNKETILLKYSVQLFDEKIDYNRISAKLNEIYELISQTLHKLQAINQTFDMFEMDMQLNDLVSKINNI